MSLLVYSSNTQTLSHKISAISCSKISTFIYTLNHINRLSISTPPKSHIISNYHPNYSNSNYTPRLKSPNNNNLILINRPPIAPKMATCVHSSRAQQQQPTKNCDQEQSQSNHHRLRFINYCRPTYSDLASCSPISQNHHQAEGDLWSRIIQEAKSDVEKEPILSNYYYNSIVSHSSLERALANHLAAKLSSTSLNSNTLFDLFLSVLLGENGTKIMEEVKEDIIAVRERDPACISYVHCLLNFKGFLACQSHRIAHALWVKGRKILALLIQNRVSEVFAVDIHPGARIGKGILFDHATGVVIGETAVIGNNVSILHNVTLGGTGKISGDRHPKIGDGVLIGAGTCVLGNVKIGDGAKIGACSVVLKEVPPRTTAVGNPARLIGGKENPARLDNTPSLTMDHTSHATVWSDYVI